MNSAFSRLLKVLALERRQGYRNKAVIGGLDKFASRWETDARAEIPDSPVVNEIVSLLIGYPAVEDTTAHERIVELILRRVREIAPEVIAAEDRATRPQAPPKPTPAATEPSGPGPGGIVLSAPKDAVLSAPKDAVLSVSKDAALSQPKGAAEPIPPSEAAPAEPQRERGGERFMPAASKPARPAPPAPALRPRGSCGRSGGTPARRSRTREPAGGGRCERSRRPCGLP